MGCKNVRGACKCSLVKDFCSKMSFWSTSSVELFWGPSWVFSAVENLPQLLASSKTRIVWKKCFWTQRLFGCWIEVGIFLDCFLLSTRRGSACVRVCVCAWVCVRVCEGCEVWRGEDRGELDRVRVCFGDLEIVEDAREWWGHSIQDVTKYPMRLYCTGFEVIKRCYFRPYFDHFVYPRHSNWQSSQIKSNLN